MEGYNIQRADNGWIISWWIEDAGLESVKHYKVFEIPEDIDDNKEDPQALIDLLYFVKEEICGQYFSKHKKNNIVIKFDEDKEDKDE